MNQKKVMTKIFTILFYIGVTLPHSDAAYATRYWDCCKAHCSWESNSPSTIPLHSCNKNNIFQTSLTQTSACVDPKEDNAYMCWDNIPFAINDKLAYGFAAVPANGDICGKCYKLTFTGRGQYDNGNPPKAGTIALAGKTMIVQASNIGYDVSGGQFDIMIPGGGVGAFDACSTQWGVKKSDLGAQYGGFLSECQSIHGYDADINTYKTCVANKCDQIFGNGKFPSLHAGCIFFVDWYECADNPVVESEEVECPQKIIDISGMHRRGSISVVTTAKLGPESTDSKDKSTSRQSDKQNTFSQCKQRVYTNTGQPATQSESCATGIVHQSTWCGQSSGNCEKCNAVWCAGDEIPVTATITSPQTTVDACSSVICNKSSRDPCCCQKPVVCPTKIPICSGNCNTCQITPATCSECSSATCVDRANTTETTTLNHSNKPEANHLKYCPTENDMNIDYNGGSVVFDANGWAITGGARVSSKTSWNLLGGYIEFDMNIAGVSPQINTNVYTSSMAIPNCGVDCYCDIQKGNYESCMEMDIIENNGKCAMASTIHTFPTDGVLNNPNCDRWGCASKMLHSSSSFHIKANFGVDGSFTVTRDGITNNNYNWPPSKSSNSIVVNTMKQNGAALQSSQWFGWVPEYNCPTGDASGVANSHFLVSNVKVVGTVVQGPVPTKCDGDNAEITHSDVSDKTSNAPILDVVVDDQDFEGCARVIYNNMGQPLSVAESCEHGKTAGGQWCQRSKENCGRCSGVWCTGTSQHRNLRGRFSS